MSRSPFALMDSIYRLDLNQEQWTTNLASEIQRQLGLGPGLLKYDFALHERRIRVGNVAAFGDIDEYRKLTAPFHRDVSPEIYWPVFRRGTHCSTSRTMLAADDVSEQNQEILDFTLQHLGYSDIWALCAVEPDFSGSVFAVPVLPGEKYLYPIENEYWTKIAVHIAAAIRLRRHFPHMDFSNPEASSKRDMVMHLVDSNTEPGADSGQADLGEEMHEALVRTVQAVSKHRERENPGGLMDIWPGLVHGRWSLIPVEGNRGERYMAAIENPPRIAVNHRLTTRENQVVQYAAQGQSNKQIAYTLGLSVSSVGTYLSQALKKLGISRTDLIVFIKKLLENQRR